MDRLRLEVREFLEEEKAQGTFEPRCDAWLAGHDAAFSRRLAAKGWLGLTWPKRYGGRERSHLDRYAVSEELLAAGAPVAAHWIGERQVGPLLMRYGTEEQRMRFLRPMARGECFFAIGMSEPDAGSDLASISTRADQVAGGWRVRGSKVWTSHAQHSDYMTTLVRTSPAGDRKQAGLSQMIVDLRGEGVQVRPIRLLSGEPHFNEVILDGAFVPSNLLVGELGHGWEQVTSELVYERSGPERFLSTFPLLSQLVLEVGARPDSRSAQVIGQLAARLWSLRMLSMDVAESLHRGENPGADAALVKDLGTRFESDVIEGARMVISPDHAGMRFNQLYRAAVLAAPGFTLRGGTNEILRGIVARSLRPVGPEGDFARTRDDVRRLLIETAADVFSREKSNTWGEVEKAGLDEVGAIGLAEAAAVVRVSAYQGTELPFAERVLLPDPDDRERGALMRSIQMCGAMARVRDLTILHAGERNQFGQPINRFQAVQQQLAELAAEAAAADAIVGGALAHPSRSAVAAAKVVTGRAAGRVAAIAHQVHGAIGFTQEHRLHRFTTKLWLWRDEFGTDSDWAIELGRSLAGRNLWEETTR
ncbi:MAG: acyl-CoA dehydrogenase family protein [Candidatus Acidiferrales bacterium]